MKPPHPAVASVSGSKRTNFVLDRVLQRRILLLLLFLILSELHCSIDGKVLGKSLLHRGCRVSSTEERTTTQNFSQMVENAQTFPFNGWMNGWTTDAETG